MLNVSTKKSLHSPSGSGSSVPTGHMAGKNRHLPAAECLAVAGWPRCAHRDNYGCSSFAPSLPRYALLVFSAFSKMNGGC